MATIIREPEDGYIDTEGLFEYQQHNEDNSYKRNIPLYQFNQFGKLEAGNTRMGEPYINTIEDQTRYKKGLTDANTFNDITGGTAATARILPGADRKQFTIGNKQIVKNEYNNNLSKYNNSKEGFGTDKSVQWSTMPTASNYQNGTADKQLRAPDFTNDKSNSDNAYNNLSMSRWKESMNPILNNYNNTLARSITFGENKPDIKEGYCYGGYNQPKPLFSQIASIIIVVLIVIIFFIIVQQICLSCKNKHIEDDDE